jgi:hypothetical protein
LLSAMRVEVTGFLVAMVLLTIVAIL